VLMSTHTLEIVEDMCDRVGIIRQGELVACGTMADLRQGASDADAGLEELFLRLTGGHIHHDLDAILG
jgi:ABC-2 type transport system ATP-binding protein